MTNKNLQGSKISTVRLVKIAVITAAYVALTYAFAFMSYNGIQFRISEILVLLCFFNRDYCFSLILGCIFANIGSPLGWVDMIFGVISTIFSVVTIRYCKNIYLAAVMPVLSMVFVALELTLFLPETGIFIVNLGTTMAGEAAVMVVGVLCFKAVMRNRALMHMIGAENKSALRLTDKGAEPPPYVETIENDAADNAEIVCNDNFAEDKDDVSAIDVSGDKSLNGNSAKCEEIAGDEYRERKETVEGYGINDADAIKVNNGEGNGNR